MAGPSREAEDALVRTHHKGVQAGQMDGAQGKDEVEPVRASVIRRRLLTRWRAQRRTVVKKSTMREARLVAVRVEPQTRASPRFARVGNIRQSASSSGSIEIEFSAGRRVHIQSMVDAQTLRTLLQELSQP